MKILVTGAFGNIGSALLEQIIPRGHEVTAFDIENDSNKEVQARFKDKITTAWGDICDKESMRPYIEGQDAIVHFAGIIPPMTETHPEIAEKVNVDGTRHVIELINESQGNPLLLFTSSFAVWGHQQTSPPPRTVDCPMQATDNYSRHKIECEEMIKPLSSPWVILRIAGCFDSKNRHIDKEHFRMMLDVRADNRMDYVHPHDVALAAANALEREEAWNKVLLIGGGKSCQITQLEMMNTLLSAAGFTLPEKEFGNNYFYSDWMDTTESQRILEFQTYSFDTLRQEFFDSLKWVRLFVKPLAPLVSWVFVKWIRS